MCYDLAHFRVGILANYLQRNKLICNMYVYMCAYGNGPVTEHLFGVIVAVFLTNKGKLAYPQIKAIELLE